MKKTLAILMALVMVLSMTATAFAENSTPEKGTITVAGVSTADATLSIYKMLNLISYDTTESAYTYMMNDEWADFFAEGGAGYDYIKFDAMGRVLSDANKGILSDDNVATFAQLALAFAKEQVLGDDGEMHDRIAPTRTTANEGDFSTNEAGEIVFDNLELGYYLADSTVGALCSITTTNPKGSITAKNKVPTVEKQVKEDDDNGWHKQNTAGIGELVEFKATVEIHSGAQNYTLHDVMSDGLDFVKVTSIEHILPASMSATSEEVITTLNSEDQRAHFVIKSGDACECDECDLEIAINNDLYTHHDIPVGSLLVFYYTARVNENAVIGGDGNPNEVKLEYGENHFTTEDYTYTKVFGADMVKTDGQDFLIDGATIKLYANATTETAMKLVKVNDTCYRLPSEAELNGPLSAGLVEDVIIVGGIVRIDGFDAGTYYFEETVVPDGYNGLIGRHSFTITNANKDAITTTDDKGKITLSPDTGVQIKNNKGSVLPSTGGMGTTIFYVGGGILFAAALVLLVAKRRMRAE